MNKATKITKYQLSDSVRSTTIFYGVIVALLLTALAGENIFGDGSGTMNGLESATIVFLFVVGLNSFKAPFLFSQANGVIRRDFFLGTVLSFGALAVFFTMADLAIYAVFHGIGLVTGSFFTGIFPGHGLAMRLPWAALFNLLALTGGFFITTLYYRAGKGQKIAISLLPVALMFILPVIVRLSGGDFLLWAGDLIVLLTGMGGNRPHIGMASMTVLSALCLALTWGLTRRAETK